MDKRAKLTVMHKSTQNSNLNKHTQKKLKPNQHTKLINICSHVYAYH